MEPEVNYLALKLRKLRGIKGYTVEEVMRYLGLHSHARISQWENGERMPSLKNLVALAVLYNVLLDYLLAEFRKEIAKEFERRVRAKEVPDTESESFVDK